MSDIRIIKELSFERYEALIGYTRQPLIEHIVEELIAYSDGEEKVIGLLVFCNIDHDFNCIIFGRDENRRFRAFYIEVSIPDKEVALTRLFSLIDKHSDLPDSHFFQGDVQKPYIDLFTVKKDTNESKLHPSFMALQMTDGFSSARELINEIMPHFSDVDDGQFLAHFQTEGFDQRLWELYLFCYFNEERFERKVTFNRPDFILEKRGITISIEATTIGSPQNIENVPSTSDFEAFTIYMRKKFANALRKKLKKKYWELEQCENSPLIFAIADFHTGARRNFVTNEIEGPSLHTSSTALIKYLYGLEFDVAFDEFGNVRPTSKLILEDKQSNKRYGFFNEANSENISAVLSSNVGTISKFNRMGRIAGFGSKNVYPLVQAIVHNPDPTAYQPILKYWNLREDDYYEFWSTGVEVYHNPNAKYPLEPSLLSGAHHNFLVGNQIVTKWYTDNWHPYQMQTNNIVIVSDPQNMVQTFHDNLKNKGISNPWGSL